MAGLTPRSRKAAPPLRRSIHSTGANRANAELREGAVAVLDALVEIRSFVGAPPAKGTDEKASLEAAFFASLPK